MWSIFTNIFSVIRKPIAITIEEWAARKKVKLESELKVAEAKTEATIRRLSTQQEADIAWENLSIHNSGWKDEYLTILLSIPIIMCFIPGLDVYVFAGFIALEKTPEWYKWCFMIVVASSFGYRKVADFMALRKGT
jgi:hypothetical protein